MLEYASFFVPRLVVSSLGAFANCLSILGERIAALIVELFRFLVREYRGLEFRYVRYKQSGFSLFRGS